MCWISGVPYDIYIRQVNTNRKRRSSGRLDSQYLWVLSMELASYHCFGAKNFEISPRFLEKVLYP